MWQTDLETMVVIWRLQVIVLNSISQISQIHTEKSVKICVIWRNKKLNKLLQYKSATKARPGTWSW